MKGILFAVVILLLLPCTLANYADIEISVSNDGLVSVDGVTNVESLLIQDDPSFTSKKGAYWLLNFSSNVKFDDVVYSISLPENAVVNYMKLPTIGRIQDDGGITISGVAEDSKLSLVVQYTIEYPKSNNFSTVFGIIFVAVLAIFVTFYILRMKKKTNEQTLDLSHYSARQATILRLLIDNDGELTQAQLEKKTGFPKSSLSRNIASLQRKGVVEKFNKGMTNSIRVKVR